MKERVGEWIVNMLELSIPDILAILREPQVNDRLVVDVRIHLVSIGEDVMSVVLVAPPTYGETYAHQTKGSVKKQACLAAAMPVVMS